MTLHAKNRSGHSLTRTIITCAGVLLTAASFAQSVPDIDRWTGGTAITPINGHSRGNALTLTWGFVRDGTAISGGTSNLISRFDSAFGAGPGGSDLSLRPWFQHFENSYNRWGELSGLSFQYEANDDGVASNAAGSNGQLGVRADLRIGGRSIDGSSGANTLAFNFFPNSGDMVIDTDNSGNFSNSNNDFRFLRNTLMHEAGHGLGCSHCISSGNSASGGRNFLMEPSIDTSFDGPQLHDIFIIQKGYGDKFEKTNGGLGNETAANATALGAMSIGDTISIGNSARNPVVSRTAVDFVSVDDELDTDFYSLVLNQDGILDLTAEVLGDIYNVGPQNGSTISFNTFQRQDITLALFDSTGANLIASANSTGLGGDESIQQLLNAGTYLVRLTGVDNPDTTLLDTQFYSLTANFEAVPEPTTMAILGLAAAAFARRKRKQQS